MRRLTARPTAAGDKLFVVTLEGTIHAFGEKKNPTPLVFSQPVLKSAAKDPWSKWTTEILAASGAKDGYAVLLGVENARLIEELVLQSKLDVIVVDDDKAKVTKLRNHLLTVGLYGTRATVLEGNPAKYPFPPYLASLIVAKHSKQIESTVHHALRPYGGTACFDVAKGAQEDVVRALTSASRPNTKVRTSGDFVLFSRDGPLPGADDWTHSGANAANAGASQDRFLKAPLGLLWFDGSLRWQRKPGSAVVRVAGGRVIVLADRLYAIDAFTGRHLWNREPPKEIGSRPAMIAIGDRIFLARNSKCIELDAATGRTVREVPFPVGASGRWANLRIDSKHLVGTIGKQVVCLDRESGRTLWKYECGRAALSLAVGETKIYCSELIDTRRGETVKKVGAKIRALDIGTGKVVWQTAGTGYVRYSAAHNLLVTRTNVYKASDGSRVRAGVAEPQLVGDLLLSGKNDKLAVFDMATGDKNGDRLEWYRRGCTGMRASSNLVTTRYKGNAAYMDLETRKFTPLWNIRPGCNNNLFPAGGLLNVPNVTGGCECNYTPTSKAFAPVAELVRKEE